jgi:hypothetical protein
MTLTERNIRAGWKPAGTWPLNPQKLLEDPAIKPRPPVMSHPGNEPLSIDAFRVNWSTICSISPP